MSLSVPIALLGSPTDWLWNDVDPHDRAIVRVIAVAAVGAIATGLFAIYNRRREHNRDDRERRRELYANAYRDCMAWVEGYYRVRRRPADGSLDASLVERFHDLQQSLEFHEGWINAESLAMGRSFSRFRGAVGDECRDRIREAWGATLIAPGAPIPEGELQPNRKRINEGVCDFQKDMRQHLSKWWWFRLMAWKRNRKEKK